jgi:hypothetical protein
MKKNYKNIFTFICILFFCISLAKEAIAAFSCSISATCNAPDTVLFKISDTVNGHAELPSESNYTNLVCCTGVTGLGNSCSGNYAIAAKLSATTNAHIQQNSLSDYANNACLSVSSGDITLAYQDTNCSGYDTTIASMSDTTNAHVGDGSAYTKKICASIAQTSITFDISDSAIGFGTLATSNARWATGDLAGSASDVSAHTLQILTSASGGYSLTYIGNLPTSGANNIDAANITNDADGAPGTTEAFGLGFSTDGSSTITSGYDHNATAGNRDWKFTANTTTEIASKATPVASIETISAYYIANITPITPGGNYANTITYILTGNF